MGDLSEHFSTWEFRCPDCGQVILDPELIPTLERIRARFGRPMTIISGYRCQVHNTAIGGGPEHPMGKAADVLIDGNQDRGPLIKAAHDEGLKRIGDGRNVIHIGISKTLPQVMWRYNDEGKAE